MWKIISWWSSGEYKGKHRERLRGFTMSYMRDFYGVPPRRVPTYARANEVG
jgi:hypothetical protein